MNQLPAHLAQAIGKGAAKEDVQRIVAQLEACGVVVEVRRWQFGSMKAEGFGTSKVVYSSAQAQGDHHGTQ